jgi:hypothetical protein
MRESGSKIWRSLCWMLLKLKTNKRTLIERRIVKTLDQFYKGVDEANLERERQVPPRIRKQALPSLAEIRNRIESLITDLKESKDAYQNLSLDEYYAPLKALEEEQARLRAELAKVEADIAEFKSHGTPKQGYTDHICRSEAEVAQIAGLLFSKLTDDEARKKFNVSADRLHPETRKDLSLQFEDRLRRFANAFYTRTARTRNLTDGQLTERADQLVADLETIAKENL